MANDEAQELLESIIKKIADYPAAVKVTRTVDELGVLYTVDMDQRDAGLVIGRAGATINSIRVVIKTVAGKNKCAANIKLNVPDRPREERIAERPRYRYNTQSEF